MANVFDFRPNRSIKGVNPQAVGEELERIRADRGTLTPHDVLEAAVDPDSPLHAAFTWDDSAAAREHRLNQARRLVVSIRVLNAPTARPTVAYVSVKTPDRGRSYEPTIEVMSSADLRARVLAEIRMAIEAIERRYASFAEVGDLLDRMKKQVG